MSKTLHLNITIRHFDLDDLAELSKKIDDLLNGSNSTVNYNVQDDVNPVLQPLPVEPS